MLIALLCLALLPAALCLAAVNLSNCDVEPWSRYSMVGEWSADGTAFYSFSGDTSSASDGRGGVVRTNWKYNLTTDCWSQMPSPPVAVGYRATAVRLGEDGIVVLAGADSSYVAVDHFWKFDERTELLEDISGQYVNRPTARYKHAAIAILDGNTMLVTGGRQAGTVLSDIWTFSFVMGWKEVSSNGFEGEALYRHSMAWDSETQSVWAFGGLDGSFDRKGELWRADANDLASGFSKIDASSWQVAPPRSASLGMSYFAGKIYVWGGSCSDDSTLFVYTVVNNTWCKVTISEGEDGYSKPSRRDAFVWMPRYYYDDESSSYSYIQSNKTASRMEIFVVGGDVICAYPGQRAYTITDVWRLSIEDDRTKWDILYRPFTARNRTHADAICGNSERTECRASVSIEEDLTTTGRPSGEDTTNGQCGGNANVEDYGAGTDEGSDAQTENSSTGNLNPSAAWALSCQIQFVPWLMLFYIPLLRLTR